MTNQSLLGIAPSDTPSELEKLLKAFIGKVNQLKPSEVHPDSIDPHIEVREEIIERLTTETSAASRKLITKFGHDISQLRVVRKNASAAQSTLAVDGLLKTDPFWGADLDVVIPNLMPQDPIEIESADVTRDSENEVDAAATDFDSESESDEEGNDSESDLEQDSDEDQDAEQDQDNEEEDEDTLVAEVAEEDDQDSEAADTLSLDDDEDAEIDEDDDNDEDLDEDADEDDDFDDEEDNDIEETEEEADKSVLDAAATDSDKETLADACSLIDEEFSFAEASAQDKDDEVLKAEQSAAVEIEKDSALSAEPVQAEKGEVTTSDEDNGHGFDALKATDVIADWRSRSSKSPASLIQFFKPLPAAMVKSVVTPQNLPRLRIGGG